MKTALRVNTDFTTEILDLEAESYEQLKEAVGGYIQPVDLREDLTVWCNEEGKLKDLPMNIIGTHIWERSYGKTDVLVGNVVFTGGTDYETGDNLPLSQAWILQIQELASAVREAVGE